MQQFSRADVERSFDRHVLQRGEEYLQRGNVVEANVSVEGAIMGMVSGSGSEPYAVRIIVRQGTRPHLAGYCTCPVGNQCKHCAAVALYWLARAAVEARAGKSSVRLPALVMSWLENLAAGEPDPNEEPPESKYRVFYVLRRSQSTLGGLRTILHVVNRSILKTGDLGAASDFKVLSIENRQFAKHVNAYDRILLADMTRLCGREDWSKAEFRLDDAHGANLLELVLASGRCVWSEPDGVKLRLSSTRRGELSWIGDRKGDQTPQMAVEGGAAVLALNPPYYVDPVTGECGGVETELAPSLTYRMLTAPPIQAEYAVAVRELLPTFGVPESALPATPIAIERSNPAPIPHLSIEIVYCEPYRFGYWGERNHDPIPIVFANLAFAYGEYVVARSDREEIRRVFRDRILIVSRDPARETNAETELRRLGWHPAQDVRTCKIPGGKGKSLCLAPAAFGDSSYLGVYEKFLTESVPKLRESGWTVELADELELVAADRIEWDLGIQSGEGEDWFEFKLGIRVDGRDVSLRPVLVQLLRERGDGARHNTKSTGDHYIKIDGGQLVQIPRERVDSLLRPLLELFGDVKDWPDKLQLPKSRLTDSEELANSIRNAGMTWKTAPELQVLGEQLARFSHLEPLPEPPGFQATLREYQREGLAWLQFLREYGFAGILADDMGLGKTVQVLAHIQMEKLAGRLDRPCLVVAPTSTLPNWRRETERFLPEMSVTILHGPRRSSLYATLAQSDLVVTNYALLARDRTELGKLQFHTVILDEAQNVKNAATAASKSARELDARHRICLSGTPIENHLDELWSLFHFLMPGFLGNQSQFRQKYRVPIEQKGDAIARARLSRTVKPFMLRRTKQQVAKELPPKTEILETVEFGEAQRDLYESIRVAMDQRVRALFAEQGFAKSRIQVLDALLKLRQVCCDPHLVKLPSAASVNESAKLERLMEMLEVLVEDGRKVLVFSQFTSMLDLIEVQLAATSIKWVRISGDTQDRDTPVRQFEAGEVPVFLISLKAGGTGLNLVAADTVIHYDPWWNPAVENQATDRAYRIGQDKPVMVYKLVVAGTVEEKILELQKRKGDLAADILSESEQASTVLSADDLGWLLAGNQ